MKILFLSDTHEQHRNLTNLPDADIIIHGGDLTGRGKQESVDDFIFWLDGLNYKHKVFIAGNHDFYFESYTWYEIKKKLPENMHYLCNSCVEIEELRLWGSPVTPWFFDWAFNVYRGKDIMRYWKQIPENLDVLISHGPPYGILDANRQGEHVGCEDLLEISKQVNPLYHLFGHIHEGYGVEEQDGTTFINGSVLDENYRMMNKPILFELKLAVKYSGMSKE